MIDFLSWVSVFYSHHTVEFTIIVFQDRCLIGMGGLAVGLCILLVIVIIFLNLESNTTKLFRLLNVSRLLKRSSSNLIIISKAWGSISSRLLITFALGSSFNPQVKLSDSLLKIYGQYFSNWQNWATYYATLWIRSKSCLIFLPLFTKEYSLVWIVL